MAITVYEFCDTAPGNDDPVYPEVRRRTGQALASFIPIGDTALIRSVLIYNDSSTTGVHVRVTGDNSAAGQANQSDTYIGPDGNAYFIVQRKDRSTAANALYLYAAADT